MEKTKTQTKQQAKNETKAKQKTNNLLEGDVFRSETACGGRIVSAGSTLIRGPGGELL